MEFRARLGQGSLVLLSFKYYPKILLRQRYFQEDYMESIDTSTLDILNIDLDVLDPLDVDVNVLDDIIGNCRN